MLKKTKSGIPPLELKLALKEAAECGCGMVCDECYSYITLKNYNSTTGDVEGYVALYVVDGALVIDSVENTRAAQKAFKNNPL
jgi:hypothetical protein